MFLSLKNMRISLMEIAYRVVLGGSAILDDPVGRRSSRLTAGDILVFLHG